MGHTTKTNFSSTSDWVALANLTEVYSGTVSTPSGAGWYTITLDTEFNYNNSNNLVIALDENGSGYDGSSSSRYFYYSNVSATNRVIYYESDGTNPNPSSPPTATYRANYLNSMQLVINKLPAFHNTGGSTQLAFNNSYINDDEPTFRVSHENAMNGFQIEVNTASDFNGTSYKQSFFGTYNSGTQYNLDCDNLDNSWSPSNGTTYYVKVCASDDSGSTWGPWSTEAYSFTYKSSGDPDWYQTETAQFESGVITVESEYDFGIKSTSGGDWYYADNRVTFQKVTVSEQITLNSLSVYFYQVYYSGSKMNMALYDDDGAGGLPSTRLAATDEVTLSTGAGWRTLETNTNPILSPGDYYVAINTDNSSNLTYGTGSSGDAYRVSSTYGTLPATAPGSLTDESFNVSFYLTGESENTITSPAIQYASFDGASAWDEVVWTSSGTGTVEVGVYSDASCSTQIIAPTSSSPIDLSSVNTTTYPTLYLKATLTGASPSLDD
jgi:hypothetical protein